MQDELCRSSFSYGGERQGIDRVHSNKQEASGMRNRELEDTLAFLELVSSVLTIQLIAESRFGLDEESLVEEDYRGRQTMEDRLDSIEKRLERLERQLGLR